MRKLFQLASLVLMGVMLISIAPASAAFNKPPKATTPDSTVCTAICGTGPTVADDVSRGLIIGPIVPFDPCAPHRTGLQPVRQALLLNDTLNGGTRQIDVRPRPTCGGKTQLSDCASPLGHLPNVSEREVRSVDEQDRIKLIPICDRMNASLTQAQQNLGATGNAESLVPAIADNAVLTAALGHARYRADDVVGIVMGTDTVMLYVHKM